MSEMFTGTPLAGLPEAVRRHLGDLQRALTGALGDGLVALIVHGSAARGAYHAGQSDVDLLVVLKDASRASLDAIANPLQLARYAARIEAMILAADEIPRAADVFPLLYDDIRRRHVLLVGEDPFAGLAISDRHRRLRVEQELREAQIRLRRAVVDGLGAKEALTGAVLRKVKQIRGPLYALLGLHGVRCDDELAQVLAESGKLLGVDTAPLGSAAREKPEAAYEALVKLLDAAVDDADRLPDGDAA